MLFRLFLDCLALLERADARREPVCDHPVPLAVSLPCRLPARHRRAATGAAPPSAAAPAYYSCASNAILCAACGGQLGDPLPAGALRYLEANAGSFPGARRRGPLEPAGLRALREALPRMVQSVLEGELASLRWVGEPAGEGFRRSSPSRRRDRRASMHALEPLRQTASARALGVRARAARHAALLRRYPRRTAVAALRRLFDVTRTSAARASPRGWDGSGSSRRGEARACIWVGLERGGEEMRAYGTLFESEDRAAGLVP